MISRVEAAALSQHSGTQSRTRQTAIEWHDAIAKSTQVGDDERMKVEAT
jgi:hypothetical protein